LRPNVLNLDRLDDRRALRLRRTLTESRRGAQECQNEDQPDRPGQATNRIDKLFHKQNSRASHASGAVQGVLMGKKEGIVKAGFGWAKGSG
jgi:hypothetical protein